MIECEHEWKFQSHRRKYSPTHSFFVYGQACDCGEWLKNEEITETLNNPTVKTIINVVIARRDEED